VRKFFFLALALACAHAALWGWEWTDEASAARIQLKKKSKSQISPTPDTVPKPIAPAMDGQVPNGTGMSAGRPPADSHAMFPDTHAIGISAETETSTADTQAVDTAPPVVPDTQPYSARTGSRFYHRRALPHSPQLGAKGVFAAADTVELSQSYEACPICFRTKITEDDFELEEAIANQVSGIVEFRYRKLDDEAVAARLNRLGAPMTKILDRKHLEFFFTPLRSSLEKNAISAGNGYIYYTSGLLNIMDDDEEVAAVLAHEISHAEFRHVLQDFKLSQKLTIITAIAGAIINKSGNIGGIFQVLQDYAAQLVMNGFSRQFELEADAGGRWILETLGHDTHAMRRVLLKLDDLYEDREARAVIFQSHPEESDRIKAFDQTLVFNKFITGDTVSVRLKFQRPRVVGWFKERSVPALYASLMNETDSPFLVSDLQATYQAIDMPAVKVEVSPGSLYIPEKSYGQIKILVIAKNELSRRPRSLDLTCEMKPLNEPPTPKGKKKEKKEPARFSFHFDLSDDTGP